MVKNLPAVQETQVQSLDWEEPLEKRMTAHSNILAWRSPWIEISDRLQSMGSQSRQKQITPSLFMETEFSTLLLFHFLSLLLWFIHSVMSSSFRPHGLQHARLPYPSLFPKICSNSCLLIQWCHPIISSSVFRFILY